MTDRAQKIEEAARALVDYGIGAPATRSLPTSPEMVMGLFADLRAALALPVEEPAPTIWCSSCARRIDSFCTIGLLRCPTGPHNCADYSPVPAPSAPPATEDDGCIEPFRSDMHPNCPPTCAIRKMAAPPATDKVKCGSCGGSGFCGPRDAFCGACGGLGYIAIQGCKWCHGTGYSSPAVRCSCAAPPAEPGERGVCGLCNGTGKGTAERRRLDCPRCGGTGRSTPGERGCLACNGTGVRMYGGGPCKNGCVGTGVSKEGGR